MSEIKEYADNEIIMKQNEPINHFLVSLCGQINNNNEGVLINEKQIMGEEG